MAPQAGTDGSYGYVADQAGPLSVAVCSRVVLRVRLHTHQLPTLGLDGWVSTRRRRIVEWPLRQLHNPMEPSSFLEKNDKVIYVVLITANETSHSKQVYLLDFSRWAQLFYLRVVLTILLIICYNYVCLKLSRRRCGWTKTERFSCRFVCQNISSRLWPYLNQVCDAKQRSDRSRRVLFCRFSSLCRNPVHHGLSVLTW